MEILYELPMMLLEQRMDDLVLEHLRIEASKADMQEWQSLIERVKGLEHEVTIALVGKYTQLPDAYLSVNEALRHAGYFENSIVNIDFIDSKDITSDNVEKKLREADGIIVPGGFGNRGIEGMIDVIKYARINKIPFLGICLGMQILFEKGYEVEETDGLGFLNGEVKFMDIDEKIPHMGWNQLHFNQIHPILKNIHENDDVYFVHSFMAECPNEQLVAYSDYGDTKVTAIAVKDNIIGCQFHPEKSGAVGIQILKAFKEMIEC